MDRYNTILAERKKQGVTWEELAVGLPIAGNSLRTAFKRGSVDAVYLDHAEVKLGIKQSTQTVTNYTKSSNKILTTNEIEFVRNAIIHNESQLLADSVIANWLDLKMIKAENNVHKEYVKMIGGKLDSK